MIWSFSKSKLFNKCPRRWFFNDKVANSRAKNPLRHEAYLLKNLRSIYAWRGSLVDTVIDKFIFPKVNRGIIPDESDVLEYADSLAKKQLDFGRESKHRLPDMTKKSAGLSYSAFFDIEYNGQLEDETLRSAKEDIHLALKNLLNSDLLNEISQNSIYSITQRRLMFKYAETNISATPDLIVFYKNKPPLIVDWKVHAFASADYRLQLALYGLALSEVNSHKDFPNQNNGFLKDPTKFDLIEYQLLKNQLRNYSINEDDILDLQNYMFNSITKIKRYTKGKKFNQLNKKNFGTAISPEVCFRCQFKKLCWEEDLFEAY